MVKIQKPYKKKSKGSMVMIEKFSTLITIKDGTKYKIIKVNRTSNICGTNGYGIKFESHN